MTDTNPVARLTRIAEPLTSVAGSWIKMATDAAAGVTRAVSPTPQDDPDESVAGLHREIAELRQRVAVLEARAATEAAGSGAGQGPARKTAAKRTTTRRTSSKKAADPVPPPEEVSGIPDTPATVAERGEITKPADDTTD